MQESSLKSILMNQTNAYSHTFMLAKDGDKRDMDGNATIESITQMSLMLPIAVLHKSDSTIKIIHKGNWDMSWLELILMPQITHFCPIPQLPMEDEE